jgi:hypothetical protein
MFMPGSRYKEMPTYTVVQANGREVTAVRLPLPNPTGLIGYHRRLVGQRLDHIASAYLKDATTFWRLCDANGCVVPDALATRDLVGVPRQG